MSNTALEKPAGPTPVSAAVRFSTADHAPHRRLEAWRGLYGRTMLKVDIEPIQTETFHADVQMRRLPGLGLMTGSRSAASYQRNRRDIDNDDILISIGLSGGFAASQLGRTVTMAHNDAVILASGEPGSVDVPHSGRWINLCVPAQAIPGLNTRFCQRIPADNPALRLLTGYVDVLGEADTLAPELQRHAVTHVHDLIALSVGTSGEAVEVAKGRGARAARLRVIKADIADNLCADLSVATVAARHHLPVRSLQRWFEADGETFTEFVLHARLAHAHRMLRDRRLINLKIGAVASESGFGDLSYFNQAFRRRYDAAPSDVRAGLAITLPERR